MLKEIAIYTVAALAVYWIADNIVAKHFNIGMGA